MADTQLEALAALIRQNREPLLARWREQVRQLPSARHLTVPTLTDHIPRLLDELADALEAHSERTIAEALRIGSSPAHGQQRVQDGFDITEVVAEYNILRGCIHDLVDDHHLTLAGRGFHVLNFVLDGAIGLAVATYATEQALEVQHRREEYLAFVAHDLRTPLSAISLAARVLEQTLTMRGGDAMSTQMCKTMRRNVHQLEALVSKVLEDNTQMESEVGMKLERRDFDLWPLVEGLIHDLHPVAGTSSTVLINDVPPDLVVFADADLLRRVFQNLIANSITYTPRGDIHIGAVERPAEHDIECWVSDNGAGIPQDQLINVFEKGAGDPQRSDSTGLGLAIVRTFVEAHQGTVHAERGDGGGTTVRFTLPFRLVR